jgi:hypothetical protein
MAVDDYSIDSKGNIKLEKSDKTDAKDHLFVKKDDGTLDKSKTLTVGKGLLNTPSKGDNKTSGKSFNYLKTSNTADSRKVYEFAAQNSSVEWGFIKTSDGDDYISTSHEPKIEQGLPQLLSDLSGGTTAVTEVNHSHPGQFSLEDRMNTSHDDKTLSGQVKEVWPKATTNIYVGKEGYTHYNSEGVIKYDRGILLEYLKPRITY